jgi:superfamily II DNA or RNA helicase
MPRTLSFPSERLEPLFPFGVRARGEHYWLEDRVTVTFGDEQMVQATVRGTRSYSVVVERAGRDLTMQCACEYFASAGCCKHLWAVLLACDELGHLMSAAETGEPALSPRPPGPPAWERRLQELAAAPRVAATAAGAIAPTSEIVYVVERETTAEQGVLAVLAGERRPKKKSGWSKLQPLSHDVLVATADARPIDREVLGWLLSSRTPAQTWQYSYAAHPHRLWLQAPLARHVVPLLAATGRLFLRLRNGDPDDALVGPLAWDDGPAWELAVGVRAATDADSYVIEGELARGDERRDLTSAQLIASGLAFFTADVARLEVGGGFAWLRDMKHAGRIEVPKSQASRLQELLAEAPRPPRLTLPPELRLEEVAVTPRPRLNVQARRKWWGRESELHVLDVSFDYDGLIVRDDDLRTRLPDVEHGRVLLRHLDVERQAAARLRVLGAQADPTAPRDRPGHAITPSRLRPALRSLLLEGWQVKVEGIRYRIASGVRLGVTSGIDWFDVRGDVTLDDGSSLPIGPVLAALRKGEREVVLGPDDTIVIPDDWNRRFGLMARVGEKADDGLRFTKGQVGLIDALLAAQPETSVDATFERARARLRRFDQIEPTREPRGFKGELRPYQREGLGWLRFLQEFGFGGCLADDMGLGKTVQVLALLLSRRGKSERPSLVVAPRSLVFNWIDEAQRFTPGLRVLDQSGPERVRDPAQWKGADVVLVTYGILRRDAALFDGVPFDYVVLDEAQAIKNAQSETAKAARLLKADHRLALSGTPVQNHLGELWSIFEFLNPGLLGRASSFQSALEGDDPDHALLQALLRPFVLRRTKEQVVKDLPKKTEQTLYCDLEGEQLALYQTLRDQYRRSVLAEVDRRGLARSKMHVLEALLRLRQAACHPALVAPENVRAESAKLEALLPLLTEVIEEGHKALVFSQFTSFLKLLVPLLEKRGIVFEYLDGKTKDRAACVRRFQEDPACSAFLISLKAGGLGLNLTAAEYVFILDPWWNPAAEAQAVDRAHRIGQTRPVMAYRIIARGTVEEKVVELQRSKRQIADAILTEDMSLVRGLKREDLEGLLS